MPVGELEELSAYIDYTIQDFERRHKDGNK